MELIFLPVYSPDLNPVEEVFSKLKYLLKYRYQELVWDNLEYTVLRAIGDVTAADMCSYYKHVGYFFLRDRTVIWNKYSNIIIAVDE